MRFGVAGALVLSVGLAGCSSTGGGGGGGSPPPPGVSPLGYSVIAIRNGTHEEDGSVTREPNRLSVRVDGTTYVLDRETNLGAQPGGIAAYGFERAEVGGAPPRILATAYLGEYAQTAILRDNLFPWAWIVAQGHATASSNLPTQTASYEGIWSITTQPGVSAGGRFDADVDFATHDMIMVLHDANGQVGGGTAVLRGTGFTGTLDTSGALASTGGDFNSSNTIDGQFYGPRAKEMAGLVQGTMDDGLPTGGMVIGAR